MVVDYCICERRGRANAVWYGIRRITPWESTSIKTGDSRRSWYYTVLYPNKSPPPRPPRTHPRTCPSSRRKRKVNTQSELNQSERLPSSSVSQHVVGTCDTICVSDTSTSRYSSLSSLPFGRHLQQRNCLRNFLGLFRSYPMPLSLSRDERHD